MNTKTDVRRRLPRYQIRDTVFITLRPEFDRLGKLKDISKNGIAFEYLALNGSSYSSGPDHVSIEVDIFSGSKNFHLSRVPCKLIYDVETVDSSGQDLFESRRCGLQFERLSSYQHAQLGVLLEKCKVEPVT